MKGCFSVLLQKLKTFYQGPNFIFVFLGILDKLRL